MAAVTEYASRATVLFRSPRQLIIAWLVTLFVIVPLFVWFDAVLLLFAMMVVPIIVIGIWIVGVPIWLLLTAALRLCRGKWRDALHHLALLPLGVAIAFMGVKAGDLVAVWAYGSLLKSQVSAVNHGALPARSDGLFSSSTMASKLTEGFSIFRQAFCTTQLGKRERCCLRRLRRALPTGRRTPSMWLAAKAARAIYSATSSK